LLKDSHSSINWPETIQNYLLFFALIKKIQAKIKK